jgi:hypothetical protein
MSAAVPLPIGSWITHHGQRAGQLYGLEQGKSETWAFLWIRHPGNTGPSPMLILKEDLSSGALQIDREAQARWDNYVRTEISETSEQPSY